MEASRRRSLRIGLLTALLAILSVIVGAKWGFRPTVGSGPAGPAVPREPWTRTWSPSPVHLVGLGDSVTAGYGASPTHSYFDRLAANPADEFEEMKGMCLRAVYPNLKVSNLSISGSTSLEHLDIQVPRLTKAAPDVLGIVVMTTGGNDLIHNYGRSPPREGAMFGATLDQARPWITSFEKRLDAMIEQIKASFPGGCHIFLADIYDPTDGVGDIENAGLPAWKDGEALLAAYNEVIRSVARRHPQVHVVPMHDAFLGHGIHSAQFWRKHYRSEDPHYWYFTNLEDPNDRGYDAIRRLFLIEIAKALGGPS